MGALPTDFDMCFLSGCYLEMVCFGVGLTRFEFSRPQTSPGEVVYRVSICSEGELSYKVNGCEGVRNFSDSTTSAPLLDFLIRDVVSVEQMGLASLKISFSCDEFIVFEGSDNGFESFSIYENSNEIVVV